MLWSKVASVGWMVWGRTLGATWSAKEEAAVNSKEIIPSSVLFQTLAYRSGESLWQGLMPANAAF